MPSPLASFWAIDPRARFLNHGSFGACPRAVLLEQGRLRARLEAQPVDFLVRRYPALLDAARLEVAAFLGADPEGLAFVNNATTGVNAVLRSFPLGENDEVLVTDHAYGACANALAFVADRAGARVRVARIPFPLREEGEVVDAITKALTPRTRLALIDQITSPTGLVLPVDHLVRTLRARGVETLVDGAHAPGMVSINLDALAPLAFTGNAHKWICAPKGAAFLWVREDARAWVRPTVISHGAGMPAGPRSRFRMEFDWTGTDDPTPWLSIPSALRHLASLVPGGWEEVRRRNRALVIEGRRLILDTLGMPAPCPESMIGSLASIPLPPGPSAAPNPLYEDPLQARLWQEERIEVPVGPWPRPPSRLLRISAQLYNDLGEYEHLARALKRLLEEEARAR